MSLREYVRPGDDMLFLNNLLRSKRQQQPPEGPALAQQAGMGRGGNLYDLIREKQRSLEGERWAAEARQRRVEELELEVAALTARHELRSRKRKLQELEEAKAEAAYIDSGNKLEDFQRASKPYIKEYQRQQFCRKAESGDDLFSTAPKESNVLEDYVKNMEGQVPKFQIQQSDLCGTCSEQMQLQQSLSTLICPKCGSAKPFLDATASLLAYSDDFDWSNFSYKRISHFGQCLESLQARESCEIPQSVLDAVMERLYDERVQLEEDITVHKVRDVLKKLKFRKYYEHVSLITCKITGRSPPRMTPEMEERLKVCFLAASAAFQRHIPEGRKNMVSYTLVCQKLCSLLGYTEFLPLFAPLKSRDKMAKADSCWELICRDLNWPFTPSP